MSIVSGTVSVENGVKGAGDYVPAKKVRVELSFAVAEGEDGISILDRIAGQAEAKVAQMLGLKTEVVKTVETEVQLELGLTPKPAPKPTPEPRFTAAPKLAPEPKPTPAPKPKTADDPISDHDLVKSISQRNAVINNPAGITELIMKYTEQFPREQRVARNIPRIHRQSFLDELKNLTATGKK
jgi:hypothetical protein